MDLSPTIREQLAKDLWLISEGRIKSVHWHFMVSGVSDSVGPSPRLLKFLTDNGVPYTIHLA